MDAERDVGIIFLTVVIITCLTIFLLRVARPTGSLVELLLASV